MKTLKSFALASLLTIVTFAAEKVTFHGYMETHAQKQLKNGQKGKIDAHRTAFGMDIQLSDRIVAGWEVDFEHAFKSGKHELEFAQIDFTINDNWMLRAGTLLLPVGSLNERHEPNLFYSVERPLFHKYIVPTTWNASGAGALYTLPEIGLNARIYVTNSLNGNKIDLDDKKKSPKTGGIRGIRYKAIEPDMVDLAVSGRVEYAPILDLDLATSFYIAGVDQKYADNLQVNYSLFTFDTKYKNSGVELRGEYGIGIWGGDWIDDNAKDLQSQGILTEIAYHTNYLTGTTWDFVPFVRYENLDLDVDNSDGDKNDVVAKHTVTAGLAFLPIEKVIVKIDYQNMSYKDDRDSENYINLGVGAAF